MSPPPGRLCADPSGFRPTTRGYSRSGVPAAPPAGWESDAPLPGSPAVHRSGPAARAHCWLPDQLPPHCVSPRVFPFLAWIRCRDTTIDVEDIAGALARACRRGEERDRLRDILRQDIDAQRRAFAIHFFQLIRCHTIRRRPLLPPGAAPDA